MPSGGGGVEREGVMVVSTWDPKCEALAEHFLQDEGPILGSNEPSDRGEQRIKSLARAIQQAIEDWLDDHPAAGDRA
jgi:hypothetical protein